jgi:hypothetical protein
MRDARQQSADYTSKGNGMKKTFLRAAAVGTAMMLLAAGCKNDTPSVPTGEEKLVYKEFTSVEALQGYLAGQSGGTTIDKPIAVRLSIDLSNGTASRNAYRGVEPEQAAIASIKSIFAVLAGKYVALDLSACTGMTAWTKYSENVDKIVSLIVPNSVTDIEPRTIEYDTDYRGTFGFFTSLRTFKASGVKTVGEVAFVSVAVDETMKDVKYLSKLKSIDLPAVTDIGRGAFLGCLYLTDIRVSPNNPNYSVQGGMLLNKAGTTLVAYPSACGAITLPETITEIGMGAFHSYTVLTSVSLPAVKTIGAWAFAYCYALESLTLGATPPTLGGTSVFYDAGNGEEFTVYVPTAQMKTAIDATGSDWYTALYTGIGAGKFKVEVITPQ